MKKSIIFAIFFIIAAGFFTALFLYDKQPVKSRDETLIMAFGDSLTYGYGDEKGSGYIESLEKKLNSAHKAKDFVFKNHAVYGLETSGILKQLSDIRMSRTLEEADYFILFIGTNDLINSNGGDLNPLNIEQIKKGQEVYLANIKAILNILNSDNEKAPILVLGLFNPYPDSGSIEPVIDEWNRKTIEATKKYDGVTYIPTNDLFKATNKKEYFNDSLHLNDSGYELISDRILQKHTFR
ncbi:GDSL-type esterase/lipase family protein [Bacillus sp. T33-2]|uniref:GDSL-type esterase/lipase family protein n=1 Tax=Bacillus sp. T33-2 TaxID=2054168 RepID=UPI000C7810E6|nr:GDSL-type esterase/lipase family protein [Bacillus sp. T33-2]PLR97541.1 hypothetical protein CVD19_08650 [Bacillus sp. T33-2]